MILEIFDVEHGACALVTTSNGRRIMIDCGHNATTNWRPGTFLAGARKSPGWTNSSSQTTMRTTLSGYPDLLGKIAIDVLVRNPSVLPGTIRFLKTEDGMGNGIDLLVRSIEGVFTGGAPAHRRLWGY